MAQQAEAQGKKSGQENLEKQIEALRAQVTQLQKRIDQLEEEFRTRVLGMPPDIVKVPLYPVLFKEKPPMKRAFMAYLRVEKTQQKEIAELVAKKDALLRKKVFAFFAEQTYDSWSDNGKRNGLQGELRKLCNEVLFPGREQIAIKEVFLQEY